MSQLKLTAWPFIEIAVEESLNQKSLAIRLLMFVVKIFQHTYFYFLREGLEGVIPVMSEGGTVPRLCDWLHHFYLPNEFDLETC